MLVQKHPEPAPVQGEQRETEERGLSQLVGVRFNKQSNLHARLVSGGREMVESLHLPARILRVDTEALTAFGHAHSPDGWAR